MTTDGSSPATVTAAAEHGVQPAALPTEPPVTRQNWAELHVDDHVLRLVQPWRLEELQRELAAAMRTGQVVTLRAYTDLNGETTVLVNPSRAAVVYLALRPELVPEGGMPDPYVGA